MTKNNIMKQTEEVAALSSIYGKDWIVESGNSKSFSITVVEYKHAVKLSVTLPEDYPTYSPPEYEIFAPWMDRKSKVFLHNDLDELYWENVGEPVLYIWVEKIREILQATTQEENNNEIKSKTAASLKLAIAKKVKCPEITHGEVITDRKSSFQGHAAEVHSVDDVKAVLAQLKLNKKIMNAKHNMFAYRIEGKGTSILQDCSDDGELHAGGRMLHLMQVMDQRNTLVIVTRWFGGIQLGPDRFRHINNASRQAIQQAGLLVNKKR